MSTRRKKQQNSTKVDDPGDDQPVSKRLRHHRTTSAPTTTSEPTPSTSSTKHRTPTAAKFRMSTARSRTPAAAKSRTPASKTNNKDAPPPSDSLLHLNDDCLQTVFEYLDIENLCQMANVCHRFRIVAEQAFKRNHKDFILDRRNAKISIMRRALCKFGHLMESFDASAAYFDRPSAFDIGALVKYCSNQLEELLLRNVTIDCDAAAPLFRRLKLLSLSMCDFTGRTKPRQLFMSMKKLEILDFKALGIAGSCRYVVRTYPKLQQLNFDICYPGYFAFLDMVAMNPHLRRIVAYGYPEDIFIEAVVSSTPSLERLMFTLGLMNSTPEIQTKRAFMKLSKLKQLKKLSLIAGWETYGKLVGPLMDAFEKEKIQLDELELIEFSIRSKDIKSLLKMKSMEVMMLGEIVQANEAEVVAMATELPELSILHLYFDPKVKNPITVNGLVEIVKNRKKLTYIGLVGVQNLKIDQNAYQNLLEVAQNRRDGGGGSGGVNEKQLFIDIFGDEKSSSFNVPPAMQKSGDEILKIRYKNKDRD